MSEPQANIEAVAEQANRLISNIEKVIVGKHQTVVRAVSALISQGHLLIEDVPGVGKTMLAKALARSITGDFKRIQFTADLLPSDVTGVNIYKQKEGVFSFRKGPLFANVLLGDEINRATPRTQSSLLEAMEEQQATVGGERHVLERPFFVIATQNPIELEGTYPLPFAQMDRFIVRLSIGYLEADQEVAMIKARLQATPIDALEEVISCADLVTIQERVKSIAINDDLLTYIVAIVRSTRNAEMLEYGSSPRGALDLMRYSQAAALLDGRNYVLPDDVKNSAPAVLAHRVIVRKGTRHGTLNADNYLEELVETVDVPI